MPCCAAAHHALSSAAKCRPCCVLQCVLLPCPGVRGRDPVMHAAPCGSTHVPDRACARHHMHHRAAAATAAAADADHLQVALERSPAAAEAMVRQLLGLEGPMSSVLGFGLPGPEAAGPAADTAAPALAPGTAASGAGLEPSAAAGEQRPGTDAAAASRPGGGGHAQPGEPPEQGSAQEIRPPADAHALLPTPAWAPLVQVPWRGLALSRWAGGVCIPSSMHVCHSVIYQRAALCHPTGPGGGGASDLARATPFHCAR